jgi:hypothetical protein
MAALIRTLLVLSALLVLAVPASGGTPLRVLATGDSMVDPLDAQLAKKLDDAKVIRESRGGTGISKIYPLDWVKYSRKQVKRDRPKATVLWIGANDGFALEDDNGRTVNCCRASWIEAYAERARAMMRTYTDKNRHLYWLNLPAPRQEERVRIFAAVNAAVARAAQGQDRVTLIDMAAVLTPGFKFRKRMKVGGKRVTVRQRDGVHVSGAGAKLALRRVERAMRSDGLLP